MSYIHCPKCHSKVAEYELEGKRAKVCHAKRCTYLDHTGATDCPNCGTVVRVVVPEPGKGGRKP